MLPVSVLGARAFAPWLGSLTSPRRHGVDSPLVTKDFGPPRGRYFLNAHDYILAWIPRTAESLVINELARRAAQHLGLLVVATESEGGAARRVRDSEKFSRGQCVAGTAKAVLRVPLPRVSQTPIQWSEGDMQC